MDYLSKIGAFHQDALSGGWSIIGASDEMNEEFAQRMKKNVFREADINESYRLELRETPLTSGNYCNIGQQISSMPKHCYGTTYGSGQVEIINKKVREYIERPDTDPEEIKNYFKDRCRDMRVVLCQERMTYGMDQDANRQIILDTYEEFRMADSVMAKLSCDEEGERIATETGWKNGSKDWVYYNSNYYYRSEELRALFKEAAEELAEEWGTGQIDTAERDTDQYLSYSGNFHQAWNSGSENGARICGMRDASEKPPEGLTLFYREYMDGQERIGLARLGSGGSIETKRVVFDIYNDGNQQRFPQAYHLSDLFGRLYGRDVDKYIENFDIYTRYQGTMRVR
ncbi:MAG: hypothetical protein K6G83_06990 [Lachnospiraceae bacterium]|nr:hypothetical protein [Lachnospiraceae bacterium]